VGQGNQAGIGPELTTGRVHPLLGSGRVTKTEKISGSGRAIGPHGSFLGAFPGPLQRLGNILRAISILNLIRQAAAAMRPFAVSTAATCSRPYARAIKQ